MGFRRDTRGQSIQIGAVLLFAVLIILIATWQAFVVPNQNERIEFNHNEEVQKQMTELRTTVNSMPDAATTRSATVDLGMRYPSRTIFRNPPPSAGILETVGTTDSGYNVSIENATATVDNVDDFWNGSIRRYDTGALEYRPRYSEYGNAPRTIYEHSVLYNRFDREGQELSITGQTLVRDDRITIVALNGTFTENRIESSSVDFDPISTRTRTVEIRNESHNVRLSVPTAMSEGEWAEVFEDEMVDNGGHVLNVSTSELAEYDEFSMLEVTLEPGTYTLQLAKVGVGTGATGTEPAYVTDIDGNGSTIDVDETHEFTVEVRDDYNKPTSGVTVNATASEGSIENSKKTGSDGQATFEYDPSGMDLDPGQERTDRVNFSITRSYEPDSTHDAQSPENITMVVTVQKAEDPAAGSGDQLPGPEPINLTLESDTVTEGNTLDIINASFDNQGTTAQPRGGTDVVAGEYYIVEGEVTDPNDGGAVVRGSLEEDNALPLTTNEDRDLTLNMTGTIDTENPTALDPGNYTVFIRGQDTRGVWTNESVDGYTGKSFEVTEKKPADNIEPNLQATGEVGQGSGKYEFELNNTGQEDLTLVGIGINETTAPDATKVGGGGGDTILTADGTQIVDTIIDFDSNTPGQAQRYDTDPVVLEPDPGTPITFQFNRFRDDTDSQVGMDGEDVTITVWVTTPDGSESATTITLDP